MVWLGIGPYSLFILSICQRQICVWLNQKRVLFSLFFSGAALIFIRILLEHNLQNFIVKKNCLLLIIVCIIHSKIKIIHAWLCVVIYCMNNHIWRLVSEYYQIQSLFRNIPIKVWKKKSNIILKEFSDIVYDFLID